jgi:TonB-dependent SusC/RagA subfamily outer membrane receptor
MSTALSRRSFVRLAAAVVCGATFAAASGCHHQYSASAAPPRAERAPGTRIGDERTVRGFPGVDVVGTERGGFYIHILGMLTATGEPLYVIDGNPMMIDPRRGIDWVRLADIVEIEVLKSPSETTVYGPRGANGVILLTTRQASPRR